MIEQKVENATQQDYSLDSCFKQVEKAGRICYKSDSKTTDNSYIAFTEMLKKNKHFSPFGHGTLILDINTMQHKNTTLYARITNSLEPYYSRYVRCEDFLIISARILAELPVRYAYFEGENFFNDVYPFIVTDEKTLNFLFTKWPQYKRLTFKCTTSIAMTRELNRHAWSLDICEQSTRYVKIGEWIKPWNWDELSQFDKDIYECANKSAFLNYEILINSGLSKQEARNILPLDTVTEVYYTAFKWQWEDVIVKRTAKGVHPQMIDLMDKIKKEIL